MKTILLILISLSLISCSKDSPKDPWRGIENPKFISTSYTGSNKFDLSSVLDFVKVSADVSIKINVLCTDLNDHKVSRDEEFEAEEFGNNIPIYKVIPKEVALSPEAFKTCDFKIFEKNSLESSNFNTMSNVEINDFFSTSNELQINGENIDANRIDELIENQNLSKYKIETTSSIGRIKSPLIICDKSEFQTKELNILARKVYLNEFSFNSNQEFPLQRCRFFARGENDQVLLSKRFRLKTVVPNITVQNVAYEPNASSKYFYSNSVDLDIPLMSFELINEFAFPVHYKLPADQSAGFSLFAHFYRFEGLSRGGAVFFQTIDANLFWTSDVDTDDQNIITILPGEKLTLRLNIVSDFICLVGKPTDKAQFSNGSMTYPEYALTLSIPKNNPIFNLFRLQNDDGRTTVINRTLLRDIYNNTTLSTANINTVDENNMIEDVFYRNSEYYNQQTYESILSLFGNTQIEHGTSASDIKEQYSNSMLNVCAYL